MTSGFSALQRAEIAEIDALLIEEDNTLSFSALQRAEIAEIHICLLRRRRAYVSVLFNEPKLLKYYLWNAVFGAIGGFSALQRAEIAEILPDAMRINQRYRFSALQRAEIAEICWGRGSETTAMCFSALQRAEIAEIRRLAVNKQIINRFQCSSTSRNC